MITDDGEPQLSSTTRVVIKVEDVNDCAPEFDQKTYNVKVPSNAKLNQKLFQVRQQKSLSHLLLVLVRERIWLWLHLTCTLLYTHTHIQFKKPLNYLLYHATLYTARAHTWHHEGKKFAKRERCVFCTYRRDSAHSANIQHSSSYSSSYSSSLLSQTLPIYLTFSLPLALCSSKRTKNNTNVIGLTSHRSTHLPILSLIKSCGFLHNYSRTTFHIHMHTWECIDWKYASQHGIIMRNNGSLFSLQLCIHYANFL